LAGIGALENFLLNQYNEVMVEQNKDLITNEIIEIKRSIRELTYTIEELTQAVKQLDVTIKKELKQKSQQPSVQLKETVTTFLEYHINPAYYQGKSYLQLKAAPVIAQSESTTTKEIKDPNNMKQDIENLYLSALKRALQDFKKQI
jgi:hypothetical protein